MNMHKSRALIEYRLDPAWQEPPLSSVLLVTAIILQHLYAPFYELLVGEDTVGNPIEEFLDWGRIRGMHTLPTSDDDPWWDDCSSLLPGTQASGTRDANRRRKARKTAEAA